MDPAAGISGPACRGDAHDFNNYLQVIHGNLEFLTLSPELKDFEHLFGAVEAALTASTQAAGLPRQLMARSKGGAPMKTRAQNGNGRMNYATLAAGVAANARCISSSPW